MSLRCMPSGIFLSALGLIRRASFWPILTLSTKSLSKALSLSSGPTTVSNSAFHMYSLKLATDQTVLRLCMGGVKMLNSTIGIDVSYLKKNSTYSIRPLTGDVDILLSFSQFMIRFLRNKREFINTNIGIYVAIKISGLLNYPSAAYTNE